jgi:hypothetical protein
MIKKKNFINIRRNIGFSMQLDYTDINLLFYLLYYFHIIKMEHCHD